MAIDPGVERDTVQYREANESDIAGMARLRAETWGTEEYWQERISGYLACEHNPQQALIPRVAYVAVEDDSVVGLVAGHLTRRYRCAGELEWINVARKHRGRGIASELFRCLATWFDEQKAARVCVNVSPENNAAVSFYTRHGAGKLNEHWWVWNDIGNHI